MLELKEGVTYGLSKEQRVHLNKDVESLFKKGKSFVQFPFKVIYLERKSSGSPKVLISVPKRIHKTAVNRNLLKRRIKEAYRLRVEEELAWEKSTSILIGIIYLDKEIRSFNDLQKNINLSLHELKQRLVLGK